MAVTSASVSSYDRLIFLIRLYSSSLHSGFLGQSERFITAFFRTYKNFNFFAKYEIKSTVAVDTLSLIICESKMRSMRIL